MIDTISIHTNTDLLTLIGRDVPLRRVASTNGGEYAGPCPWCRGRDRFRVWPNSDPPRWWCRQCARNGDAIGYIMQRDGLGFRAACEALGAFVPSKPLSKPAVLPEDSGPPSETWQNRGREFVAYAKSQLWGDVGVKTLAYLRNRGLTDDTIRHFGLGYCPAGLSRDKSERWGRSDRDGIPLPHGITIPCVADGMLWYIKLRLMFWHGNALLPKLTKPKYLGIRGNRVALFNADSLGNPDRLLLLCEGEFDAMLVAQEAGDILDVATLGGAARKIEARWLPYLLPYKRVLAAYDQDEPGQSGLAKLSQSSRRILRLSFADGGDLTDYHLAGGDLRSLLAGAV